MVLEPVRLGNFWKRITLKLDNKFALPLDTSV